MTKINDGGAAFPNAYYSKLYGMTLRDYFAGQALISLLNQDGMTHYNDKVTVRNAYLVADEMIKQRSVDNETN